VKTRVFRISSLLIALALLLAPLLAVGASAQAPQTAARPRSAGARSPLPGQLGPDAEWLFLPADAAGAPATDVALGDPGLSYRYVKTLGVGDYPQVSPALGKGC